MFLEVFIITVVLLVIAVVFLGISMIVKKNGKFPNTSVGHNPNMRKLGITCAKCEEERKCQLAKIKANKTTDKS
ncbi:MAG: hypothetical protein JXR58_11800 [Bacteroidales bacterium]|nr:hypothetical protein [Bacteroidales bacterium]